MADQQLAFVETPRVHVDIGMFSSVGSTTSRNGKTSVLSKCNSDASLSTTNMLKTTSFTKSMISDKYFVADRNRESDGDSSTGVPDDHNRSQLSGRGESHRRSKSVKVKFSRFIEVAEFSEPFESSRDECEDLETLRNYEQQRSQSSLE